MWKLNVKTFERQNNKWVLVLEHTFFGKTRAEAFHYSASHAETDSFYRQSGSDAAVRILKKLGAPIGLPASAYGRFRGILTIGDARLTRTK